MLKKSNIFKKKTKKQILYKIIHYITIMAMPNIFLFNVYNQNHSHIQISHVLILATILAIVSVLGERVIRLLTRSCEGSFLSIFLFWILFWFFESLWSRLLLGNSRAVFIAILLFIQMCLVVLFRALSEKLQKGRVTFIALAGVTFVLFLFNSFPIFAALTTNLLFSNTENNWQVRRYFEIDSTLPNPDIYWLHMDGMISFDNVEYYFDATTDGSRERLLDLGFMINENAEIATRNTPTGVSALLSPDFYDSYLHDLFLEGRYLLGTERIIFYDEMFEHDGISFANDLAPYHELFHAFLEIDYSITMIASFTPNVYTVIDQFYCLRRTDDMFAVKDEYLEQSKERHFLADALDLIELMVMKTPVPGRLANLVSGESDINWQAIPSNYSIVDSLTENTLNLHHERQLYQALIHHIETTHTNSPLLTYITLDFAHAWGWEWQVDGDVSSEDFHLYPISHEYSLYVMFSMIDMILERNSDALIVIQADHGIHFDPTHYALLDAGFTEEEVLRLYNSTISAVRIPEQYGGLDTPLDPLNITRELVNRFVGENYQLLDQ